ncbi:MAG TPA: SDR family oxidoreductase [Gammaproteobacteria bacterium]|nr:SDR family oxidoreductase [Gammaproteobacteria bacterium]
MQKVLIVGATSAIAEQAARLYAARGASLVLTGRQAERLQAVAADLKLRGAAVVDTAVLDIDDLPAHARVVEQAWKAGAVDVVLVAAGTLPDQAACEASVMLTVKEFNTNGLSVIALLTLVAQRMQAGGAIAVISSVAGDRGRQSNYVYGSAKAALSAFLSGLRQRLAKSGVAVVTIKPGFVDTPMTRAFKKGALWASPQAVGRGIVRAVDRRRDVVYLPWFWWGIMFIINHVPEAIFKRAKL